MVLIPIENFQGIPVVLEKGAELGVAKRYEPDVVVMNEKTLIEGNCATVSHPYWVQWTLWAASKSLK